MPELPDVVAYVECLQARLIGQRLERVQLVSPFLLRSVEPPPEAACGRVVTGIERLGKRIVIVFAQELRFVLHLMIAGRLRWAGPDARPPGRIGLAALGFGHGTLLLTEAASKKRAALQVVASAAEARRLAPAGLDVLTCSVEQFSAVLQRENHTLKRALTDPRLLDGIGNAYSDEILHAARLSPLQLTSRMSAAQLATLHRAAVNVLTHWIASLRREFAGRFPGPGDITAFRPGFAVHGRFGLPCPACGASVQRIVYADNETNYCARCQTQGRVLADRSLSRLLKADWPRTLEELE